MVTNSSTGGGRQFALRGHQYTMVICGNTAHRGTTTYMRRIDKVKFGVPAAEAFRKDIPATLLVLLLKLNKEGVFKKDIFRAPGNEAQVRKLVHIMQNGRLVNIANFSVYTVASVIKKFLAKLPTGILGYENEQRLFDTFNALDDDSKRPEISRVIQSLPLPSQHLLVLLFGTFRLIADASTSDDVTMSSRNRMGSEAIGISVAPSLFHTCIHDGHAAHMEDVLRFKEASRIVTYVIDNFGRSDLFPYENYEYYAKLTGRTINLDRSRTKYSFRYHLNTTSSLNTAAGRLSDATSSDRGVFTGGGGDDACTSGESSRLKSTSTMPSPTILEPEESMDQTAVVANDADEGAMSQPEVLVALTDEHPIKCTSSGQLSTAVSLDELKRINLIADSTKSLSFLNDVHERQTARMQSRSEWFLTPNECETESKVVDYFRQQSFDVVSPSLNNQMQAQIKEVGLPRRKSWRKHYQRPRSSHASDQNIVGSFDEPSQSHSEGMLFSPAEKNRDSRVLFSDGQFDDAKLDITTGHHHYIPDADITLSSLNSSFQQNCNASSASRRQLGATFSLCDQDDVTMASSDEADAQSSDVRQGGGEEGDGRRKPGGPLVFHFTNV